MPSLPDKSASFAHIFIRELQEAASTKELEDLKVKYLGKKGPVQALMMELKHCNADERPHMGKLINDLKEELLFALRQAV